ncbi:MAG: right-handed parallel beta-helix repeat-containing protein [Bacteroidetes bacterium]|nr:right-handed parallel beta-helix repeat-containing protein [Bacteroidota bacterium]
MKKIISLLSLCFIILSASAQSGSTCISAISNTSVLQCPVYSASASQIIWHKFIPDSVNVTIGCSIIPDSLNPNNYITQLELYSGNCTSMSLLYSESTTDAARKSLTINAMGLSTTQEYFIKIYNSSVTTDYSVCLENREATMAACANLLSNGGFESFSALPFCASTPSFPDFSVTLATGWGQIQTPDYFNTSSGTLSCLSFTPSPHTGSGHGGFAIGSPSNPAYKEYITNSVTVTPGTTYKIIFYYKTADPGPVAPNIGVFAAGASFGSSPGSPLPKTESPDINGYTKVTSYYTATTGALFIAIGAFPATGVSSLQYYYADDASITESPLVVVSGSTNVCTGDVVNTTFTASNGSGFTWTCTPSLSSFSTSGATASITSPLPPVTMITTYTVTLTGTAPSGCTSTTNFSFVITPGPVIPNVGGINKICVGGSTTLQALALSGFYSTIQWYLNGVAIPGASGAGFVFYTATVPGVYTVQIGFPGGCKSTSPPFTVTLHPNPVVLVESNLPENCPGNSDGQASAFVSGATGPLVYAWSNGTTNSSSLFSDNVNGLPGGPISVTVTDANGCVGTASTTVVTLPLFAAPIISGDGTICATTHTYIISNYNPAYTYSTPLITPPGYGTASAISGAGTFTVTWISSAVTFGADITVTATDPLTGCSNSATEHYYPCCLGPHGTTNVINGLSSSLANPFIGGTLVINGTFTIDNNFTINGTNVVMAAGAKIVIPTVGGTKTLTLTNNTYVHAAPCNIMWNSIYINAGQNLVVNGNTRIEDADSAVVSVDGGKYTITNSELNKNFKHIVVMPFAGSHTGTITKTNLYCRNYPTLTNATLLPPYATGTRTRVGIEIYEVSQIQIGTSTSASLKNNFRNMGNGIRSKGSSVVVYNNLFTVIDNPSGVACKGCDCQLGTAICATGEKTPSHILIVAGAGTIQNTFFNCLNGISAKNNMDVFVDGNVFLNLTGTGVFVTQCSNRLLDVVNNKMTAVINGIDMYENPNAFSMNIANNQISLSGGLYGSIISNYAIVVQNVLLNPNNATITGNTIERAKTGIWLINSDATLVEGNSIGYPFGMVVSGATLIGIRLEKSDNSKVENNTVQKLGGPPPSAATELILRGISVENTQNSVVGKNTLIRVGQGVRMLGACNNATIACNNLFQCWYGLKFDGATVGNQLNSGVSQRNVWFINLGPAKMSGNILSPIEMWYISGSPFTDPRNGLSTRNGTIEFCCRTPFRCNKFSRCLR